MSDWFHTPGPWHVGGDDANGSVPFVEITGPGSTQIAEVQAVSIRNKRFVLTSESRANAWLIASAPELLDALKQFVACHAKSGRDDLAMNLAAHAAKAAIEKAEGGRA